MSKNDLQWKKTDAETESKDKTLKENIHVVI
jgi:hypothetical protein